MNDTDENGREEAAPRPWIPLRTTYDVEAWIDQYNRGLQRAVAKKNAAGYGICFILAAGGEIYLHTTPEGEILLDVTPEADWAAPVVTAATGVPAPASQVWSLPAEALTPLVLGLSSLVGATRIVQEHDYRVRKRW